VTFNPDFKVHDIIQRQITRKRYKIHLYLQWQTNRKSYMISKRHHFQWPWTTPTSGFKVTPLFDAEYLRNGRRCKHHFNGIL